jgi:hypothetical protein
MPINCLFSGSKVLQQNKCQPTIGPRMPTPSLIVMQIQALVDVGGAY